MTNMAEVGKHFIGRDFKLGEVDCLQLVKFHLERLNVDLNDEFVDLCQNTERYWNHGRAKNISRMCSALREMLDEVPVSEMRAGDILILQYKNSMDFLGINAGNGRVLIITQREGCLSLPIRHYTIQHVLRRREINAGTCRIFRCHDIH